MSGSIVRESENATPETVFLKTYAKRVEDLLSEFKQAARGKLIVEKYDPQPDSDAEDNARLNGIEGETLSNGERFYLGLSVSLLDQNQALPFLAPNRERLSRIRSGPCYFPRGSTRKAGGRYHVAAACFRRAG